MTYTRVQVGSGKINLGVLLICDVKSRRTVLNRQELTFANLVEQFKLDQNLVEKVGLVDIYSVSKQNKFLNRQKRDLSKRISEEYIPDFPSSNNFFPSIEKYDLRIMYDSTFETNDDANKSLDLKRSPYQVILFSNDLSPVVQKIKSFYVH